MNLLVSDYDQTVSTDDLSIRFNIKKINEFRKNGNLFMLSTGREYSSIKSEVKKWNIKYDYLSYADGTTMYDKNDKLIFISKMDEDGVKISEILKKQYGQKINIYDIISDQDRTEHLAGIFRDLEHFRSARIIFLRERAHVYFIACRKCGLRR